jgi:sucrose 6(F)-phosphate phosphorylase
MESALPSHTLSVAPRPQLLTYPDSLGGGLGALTGLLDGPFDGLFRGVHILPPFPSSGDRGFAPLTYQRIEERFGSWDDIERIAERHDVLLDLMINHISRQSAEFQDFQRRGRKSPYADLFVTLDKVWPNGDPPLSDVARIFLRKPESPFTSITIAETGEQERVWTSFGTQDWSEQVDLDVRSETTRMQITEWLDILASHRVKIVRLDAVGYVVKQAGTSCFMVEPEIYEFLDWVTGVASSRGLVVLPEVHDVYATHDRLANRGYWTYDFALPGLILNAFITGEGGRLADHLSRSPERQFTALDCHDGLPVLPDLEGILKPDEMLQLAERVRQEGGNINRILSGAGTHASGVDIHQLNCTYYSALEQDDDRYLAARAIQLFARGVPQIYYVGLLAGENDLGAVDRTGEGRAINRHDYSLEEVAHALDRPVVKKLLELVRLRNTHPSFDGTLDVMIERGALLRLSWQHDQFTCELKVDLTTGQLDID